MPAEFITTDSAPAPRPFYHRAVRAGNYVYGSGTTGMTLENKMTEGTVQDRTRQIIKNIEAVLKAANMTLGNIVKANVYLTNLAQDFDAVNEVYMEMMPDPKPARTCVGVAQLPVGTDVEIEVVAYDG